MYYKLYRFYNINIPFAKEGSKNISKKSAIQDYVNSNSHKEALKKEKARLLMIKATSNT
ncbi:9902_t:CDS:2, partial [Funneliformis mosseae]